jgi:hypothetical protein
MDADPRLGRNAKQVLDDANTRLLLPAIALAEALFILERRPQRHQLSTISLLQRIDLDSRIRFASLNDQITMKTLSCTAVDEMHDRQIVATALLAQAVGAQVVILSKDENIQKSGLIPTLWLRRLSSSIVTLLHPPPPATRQ